MAHYKTRKPVSDAITFSTSPYRGHEQEILEVRNRNRISQQTRAHLDWRYEGEQNEIPSVTFWLRDEQGKAAGMASLIFRPYCIDGEKKNFAVLGDISVDKAFRGTGLSTKLFHFINAYIEENKLTCGFVLPNQVAQKGLSSSGWQTVGKIIPMVCVVNPGKKLQKIFKLNSLSKVASKMLRAMLYRKVSRQIDPSISMSQSSDFDSEFNFFWQQLPKAKMVFRDRSAASLQWRYKRQPGAQYSIHKFFRGSQFVGYIVTSISSHDGLCLVSDFLVAEIELAQPCMALFLKQAMRNPEIETVRVVLNEKNIYVASLDQVGFFKRDPASVFQVYKPQEPLIADVDAWFTMAGDKDA